MSACSAGTDSSQRPDAIFRFCLPGTRFRPSIGVWAGVATDPEGHLVTDETWRARQRDWLPSAEDRTFVASLMRRITEPGKVAGWIAPPEIRITNSPLDYEYVRLNRSRYLSVSPSIPTTLGRRLPREFTVQMVGS